MRREAWHSIATEVSSISRLSMPAVIFERSRISLISASR
jgi:hypothetical protein